MTVAELDNRMSSAELTEWMAYEKITGPLGRKRGDIQAATVAAAVANANRGRGRKAKVSDFLIPYEQRRQHQDAHELLRTVKAANRALGGEEKGTGSGRT